MDTNNHQKSDLLTKSKHFCMMPWTGLHFLADGAAHLCCLSDSTKPLGFFNEDNSIQKLWNSERAKVIRQNMLQDLPSDECRRCYELETHGVYTLRNMSNDAFGKHWNELIDSTKESGELSLFKMRYLDIRFSNICNFKCQTCGPYFSSSWYDDQKAMYPSYSDQKVMRIQPSKEFMDQLLPMLNDLEKVYFAGGEPILMDELYQIMDYWIANNKLEHDLSFTTNFSFLEFKGRKITDYWNKFKKVRISASLDDSGERGEYLRKGTHWAKIEANRIKMMELCPQVYFEITPTISLFNVWHFPEFHLEWVEKGLLSPNHIRLNILTNPSHMSLALIAREQRQKIIQKWKTYRDLLLTECEKAGGRNDQVQMGYDSVIHYLESEPELLGQWSDFLNRVRQVDRVRGESFVKAYPEFMSVYQIPEYGEVAVK